MKIKIGKIRSDYITLEDIEIKSSKKEEVLHIIENLLLDVQSIDNQYVYYNDEYEKDDNFGIHNRLKDKDDLIH